jgi:hypothetical protein
MVRLDKSVQWNHLSHNLFSISRKIFKEGKNIKLKIKPNVL